jgi:hypothetical protein
MFRVPRRTSVLVLAALAVAACGSGGVASPPPPSTVPDVGELPPELESMQTVPREVTETTGEAGSTTATAAGAPDAGPPIGRIVDGNRLLVIGDSILASTSSRYGGEMCDRLVPLGWAVEIDAESGQRIEFGTEVLDARLRAGWDAVAIMLGNNYANDPRAYADELEDILDRLGTRPVLLYNVTAFREDRLEVNYIVNALAGERDNVRIVDWAARTANDDELVGGDGLHLSDAGRRELVAMTARALGRAPVRSVGDCLDTRFDDDSATQIPSGGD